MCRLRIYAYQDYVRQYQQLVHFHTTDPRGWFNHSCLFEDEPSQCQYPDFGSKNSRVWTAEVPIYRRLLATCVITEDPKTADAFLVPMLFGTITTLKWGRFNGGGFTTRSFIGEMQQNATLFLPDVKKGKPSVLPYLNRTTEPRHIVLFTVDCQYAWPQAQNMLVVHLGDDASWLPCEEKHLKGCKRPRHSPKQSTYFENGLTVPYRISHWLPLGLLGRRTSADRVEGLSRQRRWLLFGNLALQRHAARSRLASSLNDSAFRLGVYNRVYIHAGHDGAAMKTVREAAEATAQSVFCLCPTGDSKGFTGRFWFALAHGCIPVRYDGWARNLTFEEIAWPFRDRIDWHRAVVNVNIGEESQLLERLLAMPERELDDRLRYVRKVAPWLSYRGDAAGQPPKSHRGIDAAQLLIEQLEARLLADARSAPTQSQTHTK